jgi:TDG/mug DNA glycosylase family protein
MMHKPTPAELLAAANQTMPDIIAPNLRVMFCGINPSVYSVVVGHHFARPGNRFWKALYGGGFTPELFSPDRDQELLLHSCGITNVAARSTVAAAELSPEELTEGGRILETKLRQYKPQWLAVLGISAYRTAFARPKAVMGLQDEVIGDTRIWVLPNPSGLNAHYHPPDLARLFGEFRQSIEH